MRKEFADVSESVCVEAMCCVVNVLEDFFEFFCVDFVDRAEPLSEKSVELLVRSLFRATIEEHVTQLSFLSRLQLHLHQLVCAFFEVQTRMNRQVNRSTQRDQVRFSVVNDFHGFRFVFGVIVTGIS